MAYNVINKLITSTSMPNTRSTHDKPGPLVDSGVPYSASGLVELRALTSTILPDWSGSLLTLPATVAYRPFWQYGRNGHASDARAIIGSIGLNATTDEETVASINHLVLDGSSQRVIGRNLTGCDDVRNVAESSVVILSETCLTHSLGNVEHDLL